jgi:hypothetical protein
MFLCNDNVGFRWVNGTIGRITKIQTGTNKEDDLIIVALED